MLTPDDRHSSKAPSSTQSIINSNTPEVEFGIWNKQKCCKCF